MSILHPDFVPGRFPEPRVPTFLDTDTFEAIESSPISHTLDWPVSAENVSLESMVSQPNAAASCPGICAGRCRRNCAAHAVKDAAASTSMRSA